jgi:hypothetical protein
MLGGIYGACKSYVVGRARGKGYLWSKKREGGSISSNGVYLYSCVVLGGRTGWEKDGHIFFTGCVAICLPASGHPRAMPVCLYIVLEASIHMGGVCICDTALFWEGE